METSKTLKTAKDMIRLRLRSAATALLSCCLVAVLDYSPTAAASGPTFASLYSLTMTDGANPHSALVQGPDGNLYGTTLVGGDLSCGQNNGCGTIFQVTTAGNFNFTKLVNFESNVGCLPLGGLVLGNDRNLYGTTSSCAGSGTVFSYAPGATQVTPIYLFCAVPQGARVC